MKYVKIPVYEYSELDTEAKEKAEKVYHLCRVPRLTCFSVRRG